MSSEKWETVMLSDICSDISYGYTQSATSEPIGPKFLRITDIVGASINWESVPYCPISDSDKQKYKLEIGDIVIARTGATTGSTATIKENVDSVFASYLIRYKINTEYADPFFVGFILKSKVWEEYVQGIIGGSAQPGANAKQFGAFEFELPSLLTQRRIASILSALDDKIELNRRMNETLEGIVQAVWGEWFGKYASGEVELPEGWRVGKLEQIVEFKNGKTSPKREELGAYNVFGSNGIIGNTDSFNSEKDTIIIGRVGSYCGSLYLSKEPCWVTDNAIIGKGKIPFTGLFIYSLLKTLDLNSHKSGSGQPLINQSILGSIEVIIPMAEMMQKFDNFAQSSFLSIEKNNTQSLTLITLRDTLLPRLMRGEIIL